MAQLRFTGEEVQDLRWALERVLHDLQVELVNTDDREFKAALRARLGRLERIAIRVTSSSSAVIPERSVGGAHAPGSQRVERLANPDPTEDEAEETPAPDRRTTTREKQDSNADKPDQPSERLLANDREANDNARRDK